MTLWQAFFLGLIQGMTEFLPISSSGHLALAQYFLGFEDLHHYILFNLICHLGTLTAIVYVFFPIIKKSLNLYQPPFWQVVVGTLPLFPLVFILKPIKSLFDHPQLLGPCFLISATLIFTSLYVRFPMEKRTERKWTDPFIIGVFQAIAIFPGISRSGATISAARLLGWSKANAIHFSFLLAIPAILGGAILEGWQAWQSPKEDVLSLDPSVFIVGFTTSSIVGSLCLMGLIRLIDDDKWGYFGWYCLWLGLAATLYFNFFV
ncbi:MAG: undecaprenyl-diphosphate phosphatase [Parachlamydiaceae bacterium]